MTLISTRTSVLAGAIFLAVCSPVAGGQTNPHGRSKVQIGNAVQILSPTQGADFSGYTNELMATLKRRWIYSMPESFYMGDTGIVDIRVQVRADGSLVNADPKVEKSSGKVALDDAAVTAIRVSAPFPHFPSGFEGASVELKISFFYNVPVKKPDPILVPAKPDAAGESPK